MTMMMSELDRAALDGDGVPVVRTGPSVGSAEERAVEVGSILADRNHRRARPGDAARRSSLAESLASRGMLQAVGVALLVEGMAGYTKGAEKYRLIFGAQRLAAARSLNWTHVPARIFAVKSDAEVESLRAVENLHRSDITAIEEAQAVADVIGFYLAEHPQMTRADGIRFCAEHTGQTEEWVRNRDYFDRLTLRVRQAALAAEVPATHLRELATVGSEWDQWGLLCSVLGLSLHGWRKAQSIQPGDCPPGSWETEQCDQLWDAIESGSVRYMPIRELRKAVAESRRKLRTVKWDLSLPVLSGKQELPACEGCPKNSATEPGLFGLEDSPAVKDATCGDADCFKLKAEAAEKARAALLKSFAKVKAVPSPDVVREKVSGLKSVAGAGLDAKKAAGFVQHEVKKRLDPGAAKKSGGSSSGGSSSGGSSSGGSSYGKRTLTKHEQGLVAYDKAYTAWLREAEDLLLEAAKKEPLRKVALMLFCLAEGLDWREREALLIDVPRPYLYGKEETGEPKAAGKLPKKLEELLVVFEGEAMAAVLAFSAMELAWELPTLEELLHVDVAARLAAVLGVALPVMPAWKDFDPAAKQAAAPRPVKKKVAKKKATKKKVSKKKVATKKAAVKKKGA